MVSVAGGDLDHGGCGGWLVGRGAGGGVVEGAGLGGAVACGVGCVEGDQVALAAAEAGERRAGGAYGGDAHARGVEAVFDDADVVCRGCPGQPDGASLWQRSGASRTVPTEPSRPDRPRWTTVVEVTGECRSPRYRSHRPRPCSPCRKQAAAACTRARPDRASASPDPGVCVPTWEPYGVDAVTSDVPVTRGRPRDRDARAIGRGDLDRADSIGSAPRPPQRQDPSDFRLRAWQRSPQAWRLMGGGE